MSHLTRNYVIDASVALKWYIHDEEFVSQARRLLRDYGDGKIIITAPHLLLVEVGNAFNVAVIRGRLREEEAFAGFRSIIELDIPITDYSELLVSAWKFARAYDRSVYDSVYIAAASYLDYDFYTGDKRLYNALKDRLPWIRWIGDYDGNVQGEA